MKEEGKSLSDYMTLKQFTSTSPCITRMSMMKPGTSKATGKNKFRKEEQAMAVPKILFAG